MLPTKVPTYAELVENGDPRGSAWGVFGPDDEAGSLNFMTPDRVLAATRLSAFTHMTQVPITDMTHPASSGSL